MSGVLLPTELWSLILDNVETDNDVVSTARVSRSLRALAKSHIRYSYTLKLTYGRRDRQQPLADVLQHWTNRLALAPLPLEIEIALFFVESEENLKWKLFVATLARQLPLVRMLRLYLTRANHVVSVFNALEDVAAPLLQKFSMTSSQQGLRWAPRSLFSHGALMLRSVRLEQVPMLMSAVPSPTSALVSIRTLYLGGCEVDSARLLGVDYPALQDLELKQCTLIALSTPITLLHGVKLHCLTLRDCIMPSLDNVEVAHSIYDAFSIHTIPAVRYHGQSIPNPYLWDLLWRGLPKQDILMSAKLLNRYSMPPRTVCVYVKDSNFRGSHWEAGGAQPRMRMLSFKDINDFTFCLKLGHQLTELHLGDCVMHTFLSTPSLWMPQLAKLVISWTINLRSIQFWRHGHSCDAYPPTKCITPNLRLLTLTSVSFSTPSRVSSQELACFATHMLGFACNVDADSPMRPSLCLENIDVDTDEQSREPHVAFFEHTACVVQPVRRRQ